MVIELFLGVSHCCNKGYEYLARGEKDARDANTIWCVPYHSLIHDLSQGTFHADGRLLAARQPVYLATIDTKVDWGIWPCSKPCKAMVEPEDKGWLLWACLGGENGACGLFLHLWYMQPWLHPWADVTWVFGRPKTADVKGHNHKYLFTQCIPECRTWFSCIIV